MKRSLRELSTLNHLYKLFLLLICFSVFGSLQAHEILFESARQGSTDDLILLHDAGVDLDLQDPDGNTALILATQGAHQHYVAKLLELVKKKSYLNTVNNAGDTALLVAKDSAAWSILELLLQKGADPYFLPDGEGSSLVAAMIRARVPELALVWKSIEDEPVKRKIDQEVLEADQDDFLFAYFVGTGIQRTFFADPESFSGSDAVYRTGFEGIDRTLNEAFPGVEGTLLKRSLRLTLLSYAYASEKDKLFQRVLSHAGVKSFQRISGEFSRYPRGFGDHLKARTHETYLLMELCRDGDFETFVQLYEKPGTSLLYDLTHYTREHPANSSTVKHDSCRKVAAEKFLETRIEAYSQIHWFLLSQEDS